MEPLGRADDSFSRRAVLGGAGSGLLVLAGAAMVAGQSDKTPSQGGSTDSAASNLSAQDVATQRATTRQNILQDGRQQTKSEVRPGPRESQNTPETTSSQTLVDNQLSIDDAQFKTANGKIDPVLTISGSVAYEDVDPSVRAVHLRVFAAADTRLGFTPAERAFDREFVVSEKPSLGPSNGDVQYTLESIALTQSSEIATQQFSADDGEETSTKISVGIKTLLMMKEANPIASEVKDTPTITVINRAGNIKMSGDGRISNQ